MTTDRPSTIDLAFDTIILKDGSYATYLELAGSDERLGTRRAVKVAGTLDDQPFTATLMPSGRGPHWLPLRAALCRTIGKDAAGDPVSVRLTQRLS